MMAIILFTTIGSEEMLPIVPGFGIGTKKAWVLTGCLFHKLRL